MLNFSYYTSIFNYFLKGKDNLPVNRYCPRETPNWQKKITFFYEKQIQEDLSEKDEVSEQTNEASLNPGRKPKRTSAELDVTDDETATKKTSFKKFKSNSNMEIDSEPTEDSNVSYPFKKYHTHFYSFQTSNINKKIFFFRKLMKMSLQKWKNEKWLFFI